MKNAPGRPRLRLPPERVAGEPPRRKPLSRSRLKGPGFAGVARLICRMMRKVTLSLSRLLSLR